MNKRLLSMLLAIVMIFSIVPVGAFAAEGDGAATGPVGIVNFVVEDQFGRKPTMKMQLNERVLNGDAVKQSWEVDITGGNGTKTLIADELATLVVGAKLDCDPATDGYSWNTKDHQSVRWVTNNSGAITTLNVDHAPAVVANGVATTGFAFTFNCIVDTTNPFHTINVEFYNGANKLEGAYTVNELGETTGAAPTVAETDTQKCIGWSTQENATTANIDQLTYADLSALCASDSWSTPDSAYKTSATVKLYAVMADKTQTVTVNYVNSNEEVVDTKPLTVNASLTALTNGDVTATDMMPAGWTLASNYNLTINNGEVTVPVVAAELKKVTVKYEGYTVEDGTFETNFNLASPATDAVAGKKLVGWTLGSNEYALGAEITWGAAKDLVGATYNEIGVATLTFTAKMKDPIKVTVQFGSNDPIVVAKGETVTVPDYQTEKKGYYGWTAEGYGKVYPSAELKYTDLVGESTEDVILTFTEVKIPDCVINFKVHDTEMNPLAVDMKLNLRRGKDTVIDLGTVKIDNNGEGTITLSDDTFKDLKAGDVLDCDPIESYEWAFNAEKTNIVREGSATDDSAVTKTSNDNYSVSLNENFADVGFNVTFDCTIREKTEEPEESEVAGVITFNVFDADGTTPANGKMEVKRRYGLNNAQEETIATVKVQNGTRTITLDAETFAALQPGDILDCDPVAPDSWAFENGTAANSDPVRTGTITGAVTETGNKNFSVSLDDNFASVGFHITFNCTINDEPCTHETKAYTDLDNGNHKVTCSDCDEVITESQAHSFDAETKKCACGAEEPACEHPETDWTYEPNNDGTHKITCSCGEVVDDDANCDTTNGKCTCGYEVHVTPSEPEEPETSATGVIHFTVQNANEDLLTADMKLNLRRGKDTVIGLGTYTITNGTGTVTLSEEDFAQLQAGDILDCDPADPYEWAFSEVATVRTGSTTTPNTVEPTSNDNYSIRLLSDFNKDGFDVSFVCTIMEKAEEEPEVSPTGVVIFSVVGADKSTAANGQMNVIRRRGEDAEILATVKINNGTGRVELDFDKLQAGDILDCDPVDPDTWAFNENKSNIVRDGSATGAVTATNNTNYSVSLNSDFANVGFEITFICTINDNECPHENKVYTDLENGNHKVTCSDCDEVIADSEAHSFDTDGECTCGAKCEHTNKTYTRKGSVRHYVSCDDCGKNLGTELHTKVWVNNGDGTHDRVCQACDAVFKDNIAHNFNKNGICKQCKAVEDVCEHDTLECVNLNNGQHQIVCYDCDEVIVESEAHNYDTDGKCICGAECAHENQTCTYKGSARHYVACDDCGKDLGTETHTKVWIDNGDGTHDRICEDCTAVFKDNVAHNFNSKGICKQCKAAEDACEHASTEYFDLGDGTHQQECTDCGAALEDPAEHEFGLNGFCKYCYAEETDCDHPYVTPVSTSSQTYHSWICDDCGKDFGDVDCADYNLDGYCDVCGTKIPSSTNSIFKFFPFLLFWL